jgi:hypothetical protein
MGFSGRTCSTAGVAALKTLPAEHMGVAFSEGSLQCHASHVTHHTAHITHHIAHITHHTAYVTQHAAHTAVSAFGWGIGTLSDVLAPQTALSCRGCIWTCVCACVRVSCTYTRSCARVFQTRCATVHRMRVCGCPARVCVSCTHLHRGRNRSKVNAYTGMHW